MVTSKSNKDEIPLTLTLGVLGYQEGNEWVALALEMDLRGYGATFKEARDDLEEIVTMQIGFARFKGQPEMIWKPAEPVYWTLFEGAKRDRLQEYVASLAPRNPSYTAGGLLLPPPHVIASLPGFQQVDA